MSKYYYCVNTFKNGEPIQIEGYIKAEDERDVIEELILDGDVDPHGYEFLDLYEA